VGYDHSRRIGSFLGHLRGIRAPHNTATALRQQRCGAGRRLAGDQECHERARAGIISWQEGKDLEGKVSEISSLIREGRQKEAFGKLVDLQAVSGELAYSAIAETIKEKGIDPPPVVMDSRFEALREKKKAEWLAKGYLPALMDKAFLWAEEWARGIANRFVKDPGIAAVVAESIYPEALEMSEKWIKAISL
jgi:hypothetical protein